MFLTDNLTINKKGHLAIGGVDTLELAREFGTPLYVMDEDWIRQTCRTYKNAIEQDYDGNGLVLYASKAFSCVEMCKIVKEEGLGLDVVSGSELYTAKTAGFPMEKIYFHGNNKTMEELSFALECGVGRIVVDNLTELENLSTLALRQNKTADILFRIKPGIDAHTHSFIQTGQIDSKFGVALENGEAFEAYEKASKMPNINVAGVHCHIGSQIFELDPFRLAAKVLMNFIGDLKEKLGLEVEELNLGGGYGIKYLPQDNPVDYGAYIKAVSVTVKEAAAQRGVKLPKILMEPGRSIVGPAGITLYTVGNVKRIEKVRTYVSVDGGMADNPRYIMYQSEYDAVVANKPEGTETEKVTIAGKCCESGDLLIKDISLPVMEPGDTLAVLATGAYNYSMASNYNRLCKPAVVMVRGGKARVAVRRETYEDIIKNDVR